SSGRRSSATPSSSGRSSGCRRRSRTASRSASRSWPRCSRSSWSARSLPSLRSWAASCFLRASRSSCEGARAERLGTSHQALADRRMGSAFGSSIGAASRGGSRFARRACDEREEGAEIDDDHGADEDAERTERAHAAEDREKDPQRMELQAFLEQEGAENVVEGRDEDRDDGEERALPPEEPAGDVGEDDRHGDERRSDDGDERRDRHHDAPEERGGEADDDEADRGDRALDDRGEERAADERSADRAKRLVDLVLRRARDGQRVPDRSEELRPVVVEVEEDAEEKRELDREADRAHEQPAEPPRCPTGELKEGADRRAKRFIRARAGRFAVELSGIELCDLDLLRVGAEIDVGSAGAWIRDGARVVLARLGAFAELCERLLEDLPILGIDLAVAQMLHGFLRCRHLDEGGDPRDGDPRVVRDRDPRPRERNEDDDDPCRARERACEPAAVRADSAEDRFVERI